MEMLDGGRGWREEDDEFAQKVGRQAEAYRKAGRFSTEKVENIMRNNDSAVLFASNHTMASTSVKASLEICYPYSQTHKSTWSDGEGEQVVT